MLANCKLLVNWKSPERLHWRQSWKICVPK
jgi:hypothetical protein